MDTNQTSTTTSSKLHFDEALDIFILVLVLVLSVVIAYIITSRRWNKYFPESGAAMIFGLILGGILKLSKLSRLQQEFSFEPEFFYFYLLPPIIFEAGYNMKKKDFFLNMVTILLYAILGTIITALVIGFGLFVCAKYGIVKSIASNHPLESLLFGALMSATDPVATLSIMGSPGMNVDPTMYSIIFGESVLNDAIAIVLFRSFDSFRTKQTFKGIDLLSAIVSLGSVAIGVAVGLACSFLLKRLKSLKDYPHMELSFLSLFAYSSYLLGEIAQLSGVMSIFLCGIVMNHYASYSVSEHGRTSAEGFFKMLAFVSETFVFVYLGASVIAAISLKWDPILISIALFLCLLSRAFNVFPLSLLANIRRKSKLPFKMQVMIWFSGLRGAIAFSLALNLETAHSDVLTTTTLFIVMFTTLVEGCLTAPLVKKLKLFDKKESENDIDSSGSILLANIDEEGHLEVGEENNDKQKKLITEDKKAKNRTAIHRYWRMFDEKVMKRLFGGKPREGYSVD